MIDLRAAAGPPSGPLDLAAVRDRVMRRRRRRSLLVLAPLVVLSGLAASRLGPQEPSRAAADPPRVWAAEDGAISVIDPTNGAVTRFPVPQAGLGDPPTLLTRRGDELVVWGHDRASRFRGGRFTTFAVSIASLERGEPEVRNLGEALYFVPAAEEDRVWLVEGSDTANVDAVRQVDTNGRLVLPRREVPDGRSVRSATSEGLVLEDPQGRTELWDPVSGAIRKLEGYVVTAGGDVIVTAPERPGAYLHLQVRHPLGELTVALIEGGEAGPQSVVAPDSTRVALLTYPRAPEGQQLGAVAVYDIPRQELTDVEGVSRPNRLAWSADGQTLYIADDDGLAAWDGSGPARRIRLDRAPAFYGMAAR